MGLTVTGPEGFYWGNESILKLDNADGCTILQIYLKVSSLK